MISPFIIQSCDSNAILDRTVRFKQNNLVRLRHRSQHEHLTREARNAALGKFTTATTCRPTNSVGL